MGLTLRVPSVAAFDEEIDQLECPGIAERIIEDDHIRSDMAVAIDGSILEGGGLIHPVRPDAEFYLVPPIGGGAT